MEPGSRQKNLKTFVFVSVLVVGFLLKTQES